MIYFNLRHLTIDSDRMRWLNRCMKKLLKTQDILLLGLSGVLDLFEEIKDPLHLVSKSYESMYGWVPKQYRKHNFNHLVWRNIKTGFIEKVEKNGEIYIRLTSQGKQRMVREFSLFSLQKRKWDKKWRFVIFDIREVNKNAREGLRKKLKELGFGMIQESVFISPHDVIKDLLEFIENLELGESVYAFETSTLAVGNLKELADKVWKLDALNEKYKNIIDKALEIKNSHLTTIRDRINSLNKSLKSEYLSILLQDPFLPKELLPPDWLGYKAKKLIKNL